MIMVFKQKAMKYNGLTYRARDVIADELYLDRLTQVPEAIVVSSWRSLAEQKLMVKNGKSKTLNSNHRRGMACDIVNWKELQTKLRKVGLMNDITWDRNHYDYDSEAKATRFPLIDSLPKNLKEYKIKKNATNVPKEKEKRLETILDTKETIPEVVPVLVEAGNITKYEKPMNLQGYRTIISAVLAFVVTLGAISQGEADQLVEGILALLSVATLVSTIYFRVTAKK